MLPTIALLPLTITVGALTLVLLEPLVHSRRTRARLVAEVFVGTPAPAALLFGLIVTAQRLPW